VTLIKIKTKIIKQIQLETWKQEEEETRKEEGGRRRKWRSRTTGLGKQMKWRRFGQVEKKEEEGARNPATTIMKKVTDEDAGSTNNGHNSKGAAAWPPIGEGDCPTFLSPPGRHQRRRQSGENFVGRSKWKKKRKGGIFGFALQPPQ